MASQGGMNRRRFLGSLGAGAGLAGLGLSAGCASGPRMAVAKADPHTPKTGGLVREDESIGIGMIGVGGMGMSHVGELIEQEKRGEAVAIRAVCDVYERRKKQAAERVQEATGRTVAGYSDYRELLARDDIHAVVIATPDHWHAQNAIDALEAGKDVYCQKPVTLYAEEAVAVRDKVAETGRIFQCGAQGASDDFYWQARKFIKNGGIGKVLWIQADYSRNSKGGPGDRGGEWNWPIHKDATDNPAGGDAYIDWPRWLGSAPKRPFSKPRYFQFRKFWDYSGGIATDLLYHLLAPLTIALDAQAPERGTGSGGIYVQKDDREVPDTFMMNLDYPDDYTIVMTSSMANQQALPLVIRGHFGTIYKGDGGALRAVAEPQFTEWFKKEHGAEEVVIPPEPRPDHMSNWLSCIRTREQPHLDAETACRAMVGIRMGLDSYLKDQVVFWDNARECFVDSHPRPRRDAKHPVEIA